MANDRRPYPIEHLSMFPSSLRQPERRKGRGCNNRQAEEEQRNDDVVTSSEPFVRGAELSEDEAGADQNMKSVLQQPRLSCRWEGRGGLVYKEETQRIPGVRCC